jgi:hypothetical protein
MPRDAELYSLYRSKIVIWVEDELTREYLQMIWQTSGVKCLIAGGHESIKPVVRDARSHGNHNVFGVVDGDFEQSNLDRWRTVEVFQLPVNEVENYLLSAPAIAGCKMNTNHRTEQAIDAHMLERARELMWWMVACRTISRLRHFCIDDFVARPAAAAITDRDSVLAHFYGSTWLNAFQVNSPKIRRCIEDWIDEAVTHYRDSLNNNDWRRSFAGKEILRHIRGFVCDTSAAGKNSADLDIDFAKHIARWQVANGSEPPELLRLRDVILNRVTTA